MKKQVEKFLNIFIPKREGNGNSEKKVNAGGKFNNKKFGEQLLEHFKLELEELSFGQRMLYPMSFNILMHPDDLAQVQQSLPFIFPEIVVEFYKVIELRRGEYPKYMSPAKHWSFKVSSSEVDKIPTTNRGELLIQKGKLTTIASLYTQNLSRGNGMSGGNASVEQNVRVSVRLDNSNVEDYGDINIDNNEVFILGRNKFVYPFNINLPDDSDSVQSIDSMSEIAILRYSLGTSSYTYLMKDNDIIISGSNDKREDYDVFKINSSTIMNTHAQIRYIPDAKKFQIAVYGKTRLNGRILTETKDGNIIWHDLAHNSTIFINDEITLTFDVKK